MEAKRYTRRDARHVWRRKFQISHLWRNSKRDTIDDVELNMNDQKMGEVALLPPD